LLIIKYIELIRELGHFPIDGELKLKRKKDKNFPSDKTFNQLGLKQERLHKIINYCHAKSELQDIISVCSDQIKTSHKKDDATNDNVTIGYVYLIKHGKRNDYKIGRTINPIRREGEVRLELPALKGTDPNTATSHTKSFHINWLHIHFLVSSLMDNSSVFA